MVDRLEADGLVRRRPSPTDRRTVFVALTDEGLTAFDRMAAEHEAEVDRLLSSLNDDDLDQITAIFRKIGKGEPQ